MQLILFYVNVAYVAIILQTCLSLHAYLDLINDYYPICKTAFWSSLPYQNGKRLLGTSLVKSSHWLSQLGRLSKNIHQISLKHFSEDCKRTCTRIFHSKRILVQSS